MTAKGSSQKGIDWETFSVLHFLDLILCFQQLLFAQHSQKNFGRRIVNALKEYVHLLEEAEVNSVVCLLLYSISDLLYSVQ